MTDTLTVTLRIPTDFAEHISASKPDSELRKEHAELLGSLAVDAIRAKVAEST